jgi:hypothetical protein
MTARIPPDCRELVTRQSKLLSPTGRLSSEAEIKEHHLEDPSKAAVESRGRAGRSRLYFVRHAIVTVSFVPKFLRFSAASLAKNRPVTASSEREKRTTQNPQREIGAATLERAARFSSKRGLRRSAGVRFLRRSTAHARSVVRLSHNSSFSPRRRRPRSVV